MTTITLDVPDELAARLVTRREQIPQLLSMALDLFPRDRLLAGPVSAEMPPAFKEMIDFLVSGPTPAQIVAFKISPTPQARLEELLDKNREDGLTDEEVAELDVYEQINYVLLILKARARAELATTS
jgi:hypothetical protein